MRSNSTHIIEGKILTSRSLTPYPHGMIHDPLGDARSFEWMITRTHSHSYSIVLGDPLPFSPLYHPSIHP